MHEPSNSALATMPPAELLSLARQQGVNFFLAPSESASLMVWNSRDPEAQAVVLAMRERRAELAAFLRSRRPSPLVIDPAEERFRREILHDPDDDLLLSEMPVSVLRAMVSRIVYDILNGESAADELERQRVQPTAPPRTLLVGPVAPKVKRRRAPVSDRVVWE